MVECIVHRMSQYPELTYHRTLAKAVEKAVKIGNRDPDVIVQVVTRSIHVGRTSVLYVRGYLVTGRIFHGLPKREEPSNAD